MASALDFMRSNCNFWMPKKKGLNPPAGITDCGTLMVAADEAKFAPVLKFAPRESRYAPSSGRSKLAAI